MAEYIERQKLYNNLVLLAKYETGAQRHGILGCAETVRIFPAADVEPVVHGRWEWLGPNRLVTDCMCGTCSACKVRSKYIVNTMLCPNCGAKMDGVDDG